LPDLQGAGRPGDLGIGEAAVGAGHHGGAPRGEGKRADDRDDRPGDHRPRRQPVDEPARDEQGQQRPGELGREQ
jgi:hypothetical protein